jgi:hypothetical protein
MVEGTPIDLDKLRSLAVIGKRSRDIVREGRSHPESGAPWKSITNEAGTVTEHNVKGDRQDVLARVEPVRARYNATTGKLENIS